jgi:hypothetical protein
MDLSENALLAIGGIVDRVVDSKITTALAPVTQKVVNIEKRLDAQDGRMDKV